MAGLTFTVISSENPLGKRIALAGDGSLTKTPLAYLTNGVAEVRNARSLREFMAVRAKLTSNQALMLGVPTGWPTRPSFRILAQGMTPTKDESLPVIHRTRQHVGWSPSAGVLMIDYDPPKGGVALSRDELYAAFVQALPPLAEAPVAWAPSGSSCIYNAAGAELVGVSGQRLYVVVDEAARIPELGALLFDRLALAGHGRVEVDKAGRQHRRGIMDTSTLQPERLDFVAATCGAGLVQKRSGFMVWAEDCPPLPMASVLEKYALSDSEQRDLATIWQRLGKEAAPAASKLRAEWAHENAAARLAGSGQAVTPEAVEEIAARLRSWADGTPLDDDLLLHLRDGRKVAVAELRKNPEAFRGVQMHDPLEPGYSGGDNRIALFYEAKGQWFIYSQAHHGQRFVVIGPDSPESDFGNLPAVQLEHSPHSLVAASPRPVTLSRTSPQRIKAELPAVIDALLAPEVCGKLLGLDLFTNREMLAEPGSGPAQWRDIKDTDEVWLRDHLQRHHGFGSVTADTLRHALSAVCERQQFDSAQTWLGRLSWDGVSRIEMTLPRYFGTEDTPYTRAVGRYLWTALAGRVLEPGVKADIVPVAVGAQGARKSSTVAAISPDDRFFVELDLGRRDDDTARVLQGRLVVELAELRGLRGKDAESIKAFLSARHDVWVEKYRTRPTTALRRCLFFGTANDEGFLSDPTGNRRWAPFRAGACAPEALAADREQLWAEGAAEFQRVGVAYQDAERLAAAEHAEYIEHDALEDSIAAYLARQQDDDALLAGDQSHGQPPDFTTVAAVWSGVRGEFAGPATQAEQKRVRTALQRLGWIPRRGSVNGIQVRGWGRLAPT